MDSGESPTPRCPTPPGRGGGRSFIHSSSTQQPCVSPTSFTRKRLSVSHKFVLLLTLLLGVFVNSSAAAPDNLIVVSDSHAAALNVDAVDLAGSLFNSATPEASPRLPDLNEKYGYRKKVQTKPISTKERQRQQLLTQENRKDGFHFDQSFDQDKEKNINRLGILLSNSDCRLSPNPLMAPDATHFIIECPSSVNKVSITFLAGEPFKEAISQNGWVTQKKLSFNLDRSGAVSSQYIQACVNSRRKETCYPVQIDAKKVTGTLPIATRVIAHTSALPQPAFSSSAREYTLTAFENEPLTVMLEGAFQNFIDTSPLQPERGHINETGRLVFRPRSSYDERMMYITDKEHQTVNNLTLAVTTVPSMNPLLYDLRPSSGRLDPEFKSNRYAYYLRVGEWTTSTRLRFTAIDDKNTHCSWHNDDGTLGSATGKGTTSSLHLGPKHDPLTLVLECYNQNNPDFHVRYLVQVVRQYGGDTLLKSLDVIGGDIQQPFQPAVKGPYTVNMRSQKDNKDMSWISFIAKPRNKRAQVAVEGYPCDKNGHSPYFRMPLGDQRMFRIGVRTPENPIAEVYEVLVSRPAIGIENVNIARRMADLVGYVSSFISASRAYHFIHNAKFLQYLSLSSRISGAPESYNAYSTFFNKWNLQYQCPKLVHFVQHRNQKVRYWTDPVLGADLPYGNDTVYAHYVAPPTQYGLLMNKYSLDENAVADPLPLALEFDQYTNLWQPTMVNVDAIRDVLDHVRAMDAAEDTPELMRDVENPEFFECAEADECTDIGVQRRLLALDKEDRQALISHLEEAHSQSQKVLDFATSLTTTTLLILVVGLVYLAVYFMHLKRADSPAIRRDHLRWIHPVRFWLFLLDYALISYTQACCGLANTPLRDVKLSILGLETTPHQLRILCLILLIGGPILFVVIGTALIALSSGQLVFAKAFGRNHDKLVVEGKAFWQPLPWIPIIGRLLDIEIQGVVPIANAATTSDVAGARLVLTDEKRTDAPWTVSEVDNCRDSPETAAFLKSNATPNYIKYYSNRDAVRVTIPEDEYTAGMYDIKNVTLAFYYPDALVGLSKQPLRNWYGEVVEAQCKVEFRHLASMFHCSERFNMIIPREHLDLHHNDAISNLIAKSQRSSLFYWAIDRIMIAVLIICMSLFEDTSGNTTLLLMAIIAAIVCLVMIPCVLSTSLASYYNQQDMDARLEAKIPQYESVEEKFKTWPWRDENARRAFLDRADRREQMRNSHPLYSTYHSIQDLIRRIQNHYIWKTRAAHAAYIFITGPAFSELMKCLMCMVIMLGSRTVGAVSNRLAATTCFYLSCLALLCLNWEATVTLYRDCKSFLYELYIRIRRTLIFIIDSCNEPAAFFDRISFYIKQLLTADRRNQVSFIYPGFQGETCRDFACHELSVISTEVGVHMSGRTRLTNKNMRRMHDESTELEYPRYGLQKTLYQAGTIGVFREQLDRSVPVEVPLAHFYNGTTDPDSRLAATIQIINHNGIRYTPLRAHEWNDDSYLSLYTDPRLVPPPGKLRKNPLGHGYVVQVDRVGKTLTIKGPGIVPGKQYNLKLTHKRPQADPAYSIDSSMSVESGRGGRVEAESICRAPGVLIVEVPPGCAPDLNEEITIHPPGGGMKFEVDPAITKIYYDNHSARRKMVIRSRGALISDEPYRVTWDVVSEGNSIVGGGTAQLYGLMLLDVREDDQALYIDQNSYMTLRDVDKTVTIDISLAETNAHEFSLPGVQLDGSSSYVTHRYAQLVSEADTVFNSTNIRGVCVERIPCTIVQCVDPVARKYRVEPDFEEAIRRVKARREELLALRQQLNNLDALGSVWWRVLSEAQFVKFWKTRGLDILDKTGGYIDPTRNPYHPQIRSQAKVIREGEALLRVVIEKELGEREAELAQLEAEYTSWYRAYFDTNLYAAQAELDAAQYANRDLMEVKQCVEKMKQLKKPYELSIPNFVYPMYVEEKMLSKAANWEAQFALWETQLSNWLLDEENALNRSEGDNLSCAELTLQQIMQALRYTTHKPENLLKGRTSTILHYVTNSRMVRGLDFQWRPDPLGAMYACCRVWFPDTKGRPDFTRDPYWLPCMLKLTGNAIKIMLPDRNTSRTSYNSPTPYKTVYGFYIPLQCFERIECGRPPDGPVPGQRSNPTIGSMIGQLVFRKNLQILVDDNYVKAIGTDEFNNAVPFENEASDKLLIMLGHTTSSRDAALYPTSERQQLGDQLAVYPLTFRLFYGDWRRWESVVWACGMNRPPKDVGDFIGRVGPSPDTASSHTSKSDEGAQLHKPPFGGPLSVSTPSVSSTSSSLEPSDDDGSNSNSTLHGAGVGVEEAPPPLTRPESPKQPPKAPPGAYRSNFKDWRYTGEGVLLDDNGKVIYDGPWLSGQRSGVGEARFQDPDAVQWLYKGMFQKDEFCGEGRLMLDDAAELNRLRNSTDKRDRNRILDFTGRFKLPPHLGRNNSLAAGDVPNADLKQLRDFHRKLRYVRVDSDDGSVDSDPKRPKKTLVIDLRRAVSATGDEIALAENLGDHDANFAMTHRRLGGLGDDVSSSDSGGSDAPKFHTHKWVRKIDPHIGYAACGDRMAEGQVNYADGCVFVKKDDVGLYHNKPNGHGYFYCPTCGLKYDGHFVKGRPNGRGIMGAPDGTVFEGTFKQGLRHGRGVLHTPMVYIVGEWQDDVLSGSHTLIRVKDGVKSPFREYRGGLNNGMPEGEGKLTWADGAVYQGEFKSGQRHGIGFMEDQEGRLVLKGQWDRDTPTGRVDNYHLYNRKRPNDTKLYSGSLAKGEREGYGELFHSIAGGLIYEGLWHNNMPHGRGVMVTKDGVYDGEFYQGQRHGKGRFTWNEKPTASGQKRYYEGDWRGDKPDGKGVYLAQDGVAYVFEFNKGRPTAKSLKSYRNGICGAMPSLGDASDLAIEDTPIHSVQPEFWGKDRNIKPDDIANLGKLGEGGLWAKHEAHEWTYMGTETKLPPPPEHYVHKQSSTPPRRDESSLDEDNSMFIVTIKRAEDLPNMDKIGKQDPYVRVELHFHHKKTKAHLKGGTHPEWNAQLRFPYMPARKIFFKCYDQDTLTRDDLIGSGSWDLGKWLKTGQTAEHNIVVELTDKNNKKAGVLYAGIEIVPREPDAISYDDDDERGYADLNPAIQEEAVAGAFD